MIRTATVAVLLALAGAATGETDRSVRSPGDGTDRSVRSPMVYEGAGWKIEIPAEGGCIYRLVRDGRGRITSYELTLRAEDAKGLVCHKEACTRVLTVSGTDEKRLYKAVSQVIEKGTTNVLADVVRTFDCTPGGVDYEISVAPRAPIGPKPGWRVADEHLIAYYGDFLRRGLRLTAGKTALRIFTENGYRQENWKILRNMPYRTIAMDAAFGPISLAFEEATPDAGMRLYVYGNEKAATWEFHHEFDPKGRELRLAQPIEPGQTAVSRIRWRFLVKEKS